MHHNCFRLALLAVFSLLSSCHVGRFFYWNLADIRDHKKFQKIMIAKADTPYIFFPKSGGSPRFPDSVVVKKHKRSFDEMLDKTGTVAFIVIRNDSLLYENYFRGYSRESVVSSFSVSKSFLSALVGIAIDEGYIKDVDEPITKYLPELTHPGFDKITIRHLLDMRSGIKFHEGYFNPFGGVAKYYYGTNLRKYIKKLRVKDELGPFAYTSRPDKKGEPGQFEYLSVNAQLLGMVVERATQKSLAAYMEEKVWKHIGPEYDASWSIDSKRNKEVKAFCCFNARAIDYAKMGRLYLNKGNWNGKQVVSAKWVQESVEVSTGSNSPMYSHQWWHNDAKDYFASGVLGQYVYVYPEKNIVIVRLGKKWGIDSWPRLMRKIAENN